MKKNYTWILSLLLLSSLTTKAQLIVFADDYAAGVSFSDFGGSTNSLSIDNSVKYAGTSSLKVDVPAAGYTGGALKNAIPQNLSPFNAITFWCKASKAVKLNVSGLGNNGSSSVYSAEYRDVSITTVWTKYIIPIPDASKLIAEDGMFHFAEGSDEGAYTLWFDNIQYELVFSGIGVPTASFTTETVTKQIGEKFTPNGTTAIYLVNGTSETIYTGAAYFTFTSSNTAVATINASAQGSALSVGSAKITGKLKTVNADGTLTVNVVAAGDPTTAAPDPTESAVDVISLFSDKFVNVKVDTWSAVWDQADVADVVIATNNNKKYTNLNYAGIEFTSSPINATAMDYYHVDVWTPNASFFNIKLVDFGANGVYGGGDDTESELPFTPALSGWVSYDIPLNNFTGLKSRAHLAQMLFVSSVSTAYIDNVYFYKGAVVSTDPTDPAPLPTELSANVISLFSDSYTNVPVDTWSAVWDQADVADVTIKGNNNKKYTSLLYAGVEFTTTTINASTMNYYHVDVWTPNAESFSVKLVDFGADGAYAGGDDSESELPFTIEKNNWVSLDIPLSSFTGLTSRAHLAQMLFISSTSTCYIDNVYFYNSPLPVTLKSFQAFISGNKSLLKWTTANESNNKGFAIERSLDNKIWSEIGFVNGAVNSTSQKNYSFTDNNPLKSLNYYRLKQIDFDGQTSISKIEQLDFSKILNQVLQVYPNPTSSFINLPLGNINGMAKYDILNLSGRAVLTASINSINANTNFKINVSGLENGVYFIKYNDGETTSTARFTITH